MPATNLGRLLSRAQRRRRLPDPDERRRLRERAGLTQEEFAQALGVTRPALARWESGQRTPRGATLDRYLRLLDRLSAAVPE
jgi:DNA-binding transcriptional regulator YiaG